MQEADPMKLRQLRYIHEVARRGLNVTAAAAIDILQSGQLASALVSGSFG